MAIRSWILQRITAIFIIPIIIYLVCYLMNMGALSYTEVKDDIISLQGMIFIAVSSFTIYMHSALGLEVVIEDYIHRVNLQRFLVSISNILHLLLFLSTISALFIIMSNS